MLEHVIDGLRWLPETAVAFERLSANQEITPHVSLATWLLTLPKAVETAGLEHFLMPNQVQAQISLARKAMETFDTLPHDARPSEVVPLLDKLNAWSRIALHAVLERDLHRNWIALYETKFLITDGVETCISDIVL